MGILASRWIDADWVGFLKLGIFNVEKSNRFYFVGAMLGLLLGLGIINTGIEKLETARRSFEYSFFFGSQFNYWGSLFICLAYVCIVVLFCRNGWLRWLQNSLAAVGQMALTNYLLQNHCLYDFVLRSRFWLVWLSESRPFSRSRSGVLDSANDRIPLVVEAIPFRSVRMVVPLA
ncbi:MAG: DUF418 domain-containing protein [Mariniblastus sp.]|nr:DUF418 domain-containing protein [Mariniblastus sp.]